MKSRNTFENLWENEELTDVVFYVGNRIKNDVWRIAAHKVVLSMYSGVFTQMFYENKESSNKNSKPDQSGSEKDEILEIFITHVPPAIFDQMLRYLYTSELEIVGVDNAIQLHQAAHEFNITSIIKLCIAYLTDNINPKNIFHIYNRLELYMNELETLPLHLACVKLIDECADEVIVRNGFLNLKPVTAFDISARNTLQLSTELKLFDALVQWSVSECKRRHLPVNGRNKRYALWKTIFNVRFGLLNEWHIQQGPMKSGLLKDEDRKLFSKIPRLKDSFSICRMTGKIKYDFNDALNQEHCLSFTFDRNVILTSILLTADETSLAANESFLMIMHNNEILLEVPINESTVERTRSNSVLLSLTHPVYIEPEKQYVLRAWFPSAPRIIDAEAVNRISTWFDGTRDCSVVWNEYRLPSEGENSTTLKTGQRFQLYFTLPLREESVVSKLQQLAMNAIFI